jgi:wyosine [tRNA(Phe)-imidazoG37] synthetase (radical SAM superfamily)
VSEPLPLHRDHRRSFDQNSYVYPVIARRAKGLSIGINLNPDKVCNFDCVYCQVDRTTPGGPSDVDLKQLIAELDDMLARVADGRFWQMEQFRDTPENLRRLNDIAFSGDGEPTTCPLFPEAVQAVADLKQKHRLDTVKMVLITNATQFHRPRVQEGLETMLGHHGEIWAKLEAGTDEYYKQIDRTAVPFGRVLENITFVAQMTPIVIQALFMKLHGQPPAQEELTAFCHRLGEIIRAGGRIQLVQVYTVARRPTESYVTALDNAQVDAIVDLVKQQTRLNAEPFYGVTI